MAFVRVLAPESLASIYKETLMYNLFYLNLL